MYPSLQFLRTSLSALFTPSLSRNHPSGHGSGNRKSRVYLAALIALFSLLHNKAGAQCDTFYNADAASPFLNASPKPGTLTCNDFVDIDGDGDLDWYVSSDLALVLYKNVGTASKPKYVKADNTGFEAATLPQFIYRFQFVDIDGDGDQDFFVSNFNPVWRSTSYPRFYRNTGTATKASFTEEDSNDPVHFAFVQNPMMEFGFYDIDGDGDMDFGYSSFNISANGYRTYTYLNTGSAAWPSYTLYSTDVNGYWDYNRLYVDWNKDGLVDYFNGFTFYRNNGPAAAPTYTQTSAGIPAFTNNAPWNFVDLNGDGSPECVSVTGNYSTLPPVAVIVATGQTVGGKPVTKLSSGATANAYVYSWEYNGKKIAPYHKSFIYAVKPGVYTLYITNKCGTGASLPYDTRIGVSAPTVGREMIALQKAGSSIAVKAYPNPFTNAFTITFPPLVKGKTTLRIIDIMGRTVLTGATAGGTVTLGASLGKGTYLLQVWQNGQLIHTEKMLKQ